MEWDEKSGLFLGADYLVCTERYVLLYKDVEGCSMTGRRVRKVGSTQRKTARLSLRMEKEQLLVASCLLRKDGFHPGCELPSRNVQGLGWSCHVILAPRRVEPILLAAKAGVTVVLSVGISSPSSCV